MKVVKLNECELTHLMVMSSVKRLLSLGHSAESGHSLGSRVNDLIDARLDEIRRKCADDLSLLANNGAADEVLHVSAIATFALAGIEIADQVHREAVLLN